MWKSSLKCSGWICLVVACTKLSGTQGKREGGGGCNYLSIDKGQKQGLAQALSASLNGKRVLEKV